MYYASNTGSNPGFSGWVGLEIMTNCISLNIYQKIIMFIYMTKTSIAGAKEVIWAYQNSQKNYFERFLKISPD